jgi:hypothetical protein
MTGRPSRLLGLAAAGCAALLCVAGCASPGAGGGPAASGDAPAKDPAFVLVASRPVPAGTVLRAEDIEPLAERTASWARTDGSPAFEVRTRWADNCAQRADPRGERAMERTPDGSVALQWQRDAGDGSRTNFIPPLLLTRAELREGEAVSGRSGVRTVRQGILEHDDGSALRELRIASLDRIRTPLGEFEAFRVDAVLTMKVPFASMRRETSTWVRAGQGPVAVRSEERILVMGVVPRNSSELRVLLPGDAAP